MSLYRFLFKVKHLKLEKDNSEKAIKPSKESELNKEKLTDQNENVENSRKAEKRKERRQKKKEKRALLIEQNHIHEGKGQGKAIR